MNVKLFMIELNDSAINQFHPKYAVIKDTLH